MNYYERHLGDYAKNTNHLSMLEHGAYTLLLDRYYSTEKPIPAGQVYRISLARTKDEKAAVDAVLDEFFTLLDGAWHKNRCDREIARAQKKTLAARENGRAGGRPNGSAKNTQNQQNEKPNGFAMGYDPETQPKAYQKPEASSQKPVARSQKPGEKKKNIARERAQIFNPKIITDYGVPVQVALDFVAHRKSKKAPLTQTAWDGIVKEIEKAGLSISKGLEMCMVRNWQGFNAEWVQNKASPQPLSSAGMKTAAAAQRFLEKRRWQK